jgi:predicted SAM-dependent methyltransferase/glycosyltransferase involved in cell wall biosynthesis
MSNVCLHVHVLYEYTADQIPHGCSEIRLLRPLSHPSVQSDVVLTSGLEIPSTPVDVVIVERLWNYSHCENRQGSILEEVNRRGIPVIFEIDDDLFSVDDEAGARPWPSVGQKMWMRRILREADGVIVSTLNLAARFGSLNSNIVVLPNQLDELLFQTSKSIAQESTDTDEIVCGYMGTHTHMDDLLSVLAPLRDILTRHKKKLTLEIVGVGDGALIQELFPGHSVRIHAVPDDMVKYPEFTSWMQKNLHWDFAIAPLVDTTFTQSKSDIKFLDYAVQGIPAIFSDVPAYRNTVQHLETGMIAQSSYASWSECLERMVSDRDLRLKIARNAHAKVWEERMLATRAKDWLKAIKNIITNSSAGRGLKRAKSFRVVQKAVSKIKNDLSRNQKVLYGLNTTGLGLEIGPSFSPVASKREGYQVEILDHADAEMLKEKYQGHGVNVDNIEEVDYVWSGQSMDELTEKKNHYDWIIASHVVEHTPDLISFLQQCEIMLKVGGVLSLVVPDHRYCFDRFRSVSTPGEFIQAYFDRRSKHSIGTIWDHHSMITKKGGIVAWYPGYQGEYKLHHTLGEALEVFERAQKSDDYIDAHNWRFTPGSFELILNDFALLGYCGLSVKNVFPTEGCEFFVQLEKVEQVSELESFDSKRCGLLNTVLEESLVRE